MDKKNWQDRRREVSDLIAEVEALARELGVPASDERQPHPEAAADKTATAPQSWPQPADAATSPRRPGDPPWWETEPSDESLEVPAVSLPPLPKAAEPETDVQARPWSPQAAMEPVPQLPARRSVPVAAEPATRMPRRWRLMSVGAVAGAIVAVVVYVLTTRVDLVKTGGPATVQPSAQLTVSGLRTTTAISVAGADTAPAEDHFPPTVRTVVVDMVVDGATTGDSLEYRVEMISAGAPVATIADQVQPVAIGSNHHVEYAVTAPGALTLGQYRVSVFHGQRLLGVTTFTVAAPAPPTTTATPTGKPTAKP